MQAQANFVRVRINEVVGQPEGSAPPRQELLCVVRALLKKIKQRVLVGDYVEVSSIDWTDGRGGSTLCPAACTWAWSGGPCKSVCQLLEVL